MSAAASPDLDGVSSLNLPPAVRKPPAVFSEKVVGQVVFTPERILMMTTMKALNHPWREIYDNLNALPGPKIASVDSVSGRYYGLKGLGKLPKVKNIAKPPANSAAGEDDDAARRLAEMVSQPKAAAPAASSKKPILVSHEAARRWAGERGLVSGVEKLDLDKVNVKRMQLGEPPFQLRDARA